jgi:hypothetical protein
MARKICGVGDMYVGLCGRPADPKPATRVLGRKVHTLDWPVSCSASLMSTRQRSVRMGPRGTSIGLDGLDTHLPLFGEIMIPE